MLIFSFLSYQVLQFSQKLAQTYLTISSIQLNDIFMIFWVFWVFWGQKEPNLIENQHFRAKSTNFWCSKKFSRPPGSWFITKMAMNLYFSNIYKSILGIFHILTQIHFLAEIRAEFYEILKNWPKSALSDLIKWLKIKISKIPKIDL